MSIGGATNIIIERNGTVFETVTESVSDQPCYDLSAVADYHGPTKTVPL